MSDEDGWMEWRHPLQRRLEAIRQVRGTGDEGMSDQGPKMNTDRELWRGQDEGNGSYYADSIHVTVGGGIGMNVGGHVIVMPIREWHKLARERDQKGEQTRVA